MRNVIVFCWVNGGQSRCGKQYTVYKRMWLKTIKRNGDFTWTNVKADARRMTPEMARSCALVNGGCTLKVKS